MRGRDELEEDEFDFDEYDLPRNTYGEEEQQDGYDPADVLFVIPVSHSTLSLTHHSGQGFEQSNSRSSRTRRASQSAFGASPLSCLLPLCA
jgi:hypothetical protein